ncbi:MAG: hypothetical protein C0490_14680, partial [Marivirga sp.]|nr:hypothetical protein [Marivirga sp.]
MSDFYLSEYDRNFFAENGYLIGPIIWDASKLSQVLFELEEVRQGRYETGKKPSVVGWDLKRGSFATLFASNALRDMMC